MPAPPSPQRQGQRPGKGSAVGTQAAELTTPLLLISLKGVPGVQLLTSASRQPYWPGKREETRTLPGGLACSGVAAQPGPGPQAHSPGGRETLSKGYTCLSGGRRGSWSSWVLVGGLEPLGRGHAGLRPLALQRSLRGKANFRARDYHLLLRVREVGRLYPRRPRLQCPVSQACVPPQQPSTRAEKGAAQTPGHTAGPQGHSGPHWTPIWLNVPMLTDCPPPSPLCPPCQW